MYPKGSVEGEGVEQTIAVRSAVLPDGEKLVVGPATIRISGAHIVAVERHLEPGRPVTEGLLAPAFVNAHTHLAMSAFRGVGGLAAMRGNVVEDLYFHLERHLEAEDVSAFARLAIAESLLAGVGTVWDHYYFGEAVAEACVLAGISAVVAPTLQDRAGPGVARLEEQLACTEAMAADGRLEAAGVVPAFGPHATDTVSAELWRRVVDGAERLRVPIHAHAAQSAEEYARAWDDRGTSPIGWLRAEGWLDAAPATLLVHALYADRDDLQGLDPSRVALGYCPGSQIQYCFPAATSRWRALGQRVVIGTDCGACNDGMNVQQELRMAASGPLFGVVASGAFRAFWEGDRAAAQRVAAARKQILAEAEIEPAVLLHAVWEGPGTLHPRLRVGAIRPGYRANLVLYDSEHPCFWPGTDPLRALALQDVAPAIERMMLGGRWLSPPGEHRRAVLDAPWLHDARERARARLGPLLGRSAELRGGSACV